MTFSPPCSQAQGSVQHRDAALSFDRSEGFRAELIGLRFVERIEGSNRSIFVNDEQRDNFRLGIATIRIEKPEGVFHGVEPS